MVTLKEYINSNSQAKEVYDKVRGKYILKSHDLSHTERVAEYCLQIAQLEGGDTELLVLASILHDLGRGEQTEDESHSNLSVEHARSVLRGCYKEEEIDKVVEIIRCHSTNSSRQPETLEEKIFYDADKMDGYGFLGVARFFTLAGEKQWGIEESLNNAVKKITLLGEHKGFHTKTAKKIGHGKALRAFAFYYRLSKELKNKDIEEKLENFIVNVYGIKGKIILGIIDKLY